eukprot:4717481-Pleurochrysis_carterae.AAC.1
MKCAHAHTGCMRTHDVRGQRGRGRQAHLCTTRAQALDACACMLRAHDGRCAAGSACEGSARRPRRVQQHAHAATASD